MEVLKMEQKDINTETMLKTEEPSILAATTEQFKLEYTLNVVRELQKLKAEYQTLETKHQQILTEHKKLQTEHETLQKEHTELQRDHKELHTEHEKLQDEQRNLKTERQTDLTGQQKPKVEFQSNQVKNQCHVAFDIKDTTYGHSSNKTVNKHYQKKFSDCSISSPAISSSDPNINKINENCTCVQKQANLRGLVTRLTLFSTSKYQTLKIKAENSKTCERIAELDFPNSDEPEEDEDFPNDRKRKTDQITVLNVPRKYKKEAAIDNTPNDVDGNLESILADSKITYTENDLRGNSDAENLSSSELDAEDVKIELEDGEILSGSCEFKTESDEDHVSNGNEVIGHLTDGTELERNSQGAWQQRVLRGETPFKQVFRAYKDDNVFKNDHVVVEQEISTTEDSNMTFDCTDCTSRFQSTDHRETKMDYKCPWCSNPFSSIASLTQHMLTHNTHHPDFLSTSLPSLPTLNHLHHKVRSKVKSEMKSKVKDSIESEIKSKVISTEKSKVKPKVKSEVGTRDEPMVISQVKSTEVESKFKVESNVKQEVKSKVTPEVKCDTCGETFTKDVDLALHICEHTTDEKTFKYSECKTSFTVKRNLTVHMRTHKGSKSYCCEECDASFSRATDLKSHARQHGVKRHMCTQCLASFCRPADLKLHMRLHTGEKPFQCEDCGAAFATSSNLAVHRRIHTGERPFQCEQCGASFNQLGHLKRHRSQHSTETNFCCPHCPETFGNQYKLKVHMRRHDSSNKFRCAKCGAAFARLSLLTEHLRTHTGEKPYPCPHCPASFARPANLKVHCRRHTGERPFTCPRCKQAFTQSTSLSRHLRSQNACRPLPPSTQTPPNSLHDSTHNKGRAQEDPEKIEEDPGKYEEDSGKT